MAGKPGLILGVDIGGTKVAAGLVNAEGEIVFKMRAPMVSDGNAAAGLAAVCRAIDAALAAPEARSAGPAAIGICSPGPLDPFRGVVINPPNLRCWSNFPLADEIRRAYSLPARVDNDANAAALAEALWGAARGHSSVFYATIGTGIGTGIVFDRRIYHGRTGAAGEGGHVSIDYHGPRCGCGKRGCIEALASGPAIAERARAAVAAEARGNSKLLELAGGKLEAISAEMVGEAWRAGDALAATVLEQTADLLGVWLGNIVDLLEPEVMVIGGGVSELLSGWFERIRGVMPKWSINSRCREIPLVAASYGADAGIAGAAALCVGPSDPVIG